MTDYILHENYYNDKNAINKIKSDFSTYVKNFVSTPKKPGEHEKFEVLLDHAHFSVTFENTRLLIEYNTDIPVVSLMGHLWFLSSESAILTDIFSKLQIISTSYRYLETLHSSPDLTVVRFERGNDMASFQLIKVGDERKLLLSPLENHPLDPQIEGYIVKDLSNGEKTIMA